MFETNCRRQNVYFTQNTSTEKVLYILRGQNSGKLPDLVNESISKQTVGAKTFILHILPRINTFVTNCMSRKVAYSLMLE